MSVTRITEPKARHSQVDLALVKHLSEILNEIMPVLAATRRENYLAHIQEGSTEEEATESVKYDADFLFKD